MTIDGRTGMPFVLNTMQEMTQWNRTMIAMGFVGKNLECADQLLQEGDRDHTERGRKMRETGLAMIDTMAIYCLVIALLLLFANPLLK